MGKIKLDGNIELDQKKIIPNLSDRPIQSFNSDVFGFRERYVDKIFSYILDEALLPLTIAITGEWGAGKSSVINMLKEKLRNK